MKRLTYSPRRHLPLLPLSVAFAGDELTIVSWGGAYQESQRKAYIEPYNKAGNTAKEEEYSGEIAKMRAMVESKAVTWDVVDVDTQTALTGCAEGFLEKIDWAKLGYDKKNFVGAEFAECAVPTIIYSTVIAYDNVKTPNGPQTIADVFDLAKFPGKRGLQKNPFVNLEWALIADGVPITDVYTVLATPEGVDRAFKKLDTIKSEVVWWEAGAQPPQLLADGQVVMTSAWNGRIYERRQEGQQALHDHVGHPGFRLGFLGHHEGYAEDRGGLPLPDLRQQRRASGRPDQLHFLRSGQ